MCGREGDQIGCETAFRGWGLPSTLAGRRDRVDWNWTNLRPQDDVAQINTVRTQVKFVWPKLDFQAAFSGVPKLPLSALRGRMSNIPTDW